MSSRGILWDSTLSIRGGTDPAFVQAQSSDTSIAQPLPPDALVSEGDSAASLNFHVNATGDATLSASQPSSFIAVPDSSLRTHVFERGLAFSSAPVLSAELQTAVGIVSPGEGLRAAVIATSLDPQKLVLSNSASTPGQASVTASPNQSIYLQALSGVLPGDKAPVRLEAPGYVTSQSDVTFAAAELQAQNPGTPLSLQPLANATWTLLYGPLDNQGNVSFNGSLRPGVNLSLQISSSDSSIVTIPQPSVALSGYMSVPLRPLGPGHAQLLVQGPPQITNRVAAVDVVVGNYQFQSPQVDQPTRYLVSKFTVTNPRPQPTVITISGSGSVPVRFGTASSGAGLPSAGSLTVTLNANEIRTLYLEPAGQGNSFQIQLTASDFARATIFSQFVQDPMLKFLQSGPLNVSLGGGTVPLTMVLSGGQNRESPLGTAYGPVNIQLQSSNLNVVRVPAAPVVFAPGDSRNDALLQPVGRGDAVVSLIVPAGFAGTVPARQDIVVSVR